MNTLKPLLVVAVLAGIGYGVYVRINSGSNEPPPGVAEGWDVTPKVQLPESTPQGGPPGWPGGGGSAGGSIAPPFAGSRGQAPPAAPPHADMANHAAAGRGAMESAPAYAPPGGAPPTQAPPGYGNEAPTGYDTAGGAPPAADGSNPYTYLPPHDPASPGAPPAGAEMAGNPAAADPYGKPAPPYGASASDPYGTPAADPYGTAPVDAYGSAASDPYGAPPSDPGAYGAGGPAAAGNAGGFVAIVEAARRDLETGQMAGALRQLSAHYDSPQLSPAEQQQLRQLLDQVAGTVVYSTQHLLEVPYEVQPGERLEDIAARYEVPWQLLAKINGIDDPQSLRPGERLKVVRGPFCAVISLEKREMTLMLADGSYAGRFAIGIGREHPPREGVFNVSDKRMNPPYQGVDRAIPPGDANNPLGHYWIGLGPELGIHGTNQPENIGRTDLPGSISMGPRDVADVFDILSVGSKVTIRR